MHASPARLHHACKSITQRGVAVQWLFNNSSWSAFPASRLQAQASANVHWRCVNQQCRCQQQMWCACCCSQRLGSNVASLGSSAVVGGWVNDCCRLPVCRVCQQVGVWWEMHTFSAASGYTGVDTDTRAMGKKEHHLRSSRESPIVSKACSRVVYVCAAHSSSFAVHVLTETTFLQHHACLCWYAPNHICV